MIDFGKVRSTVRPEPIVIDEYSVWENTNIQEVSENVGEDNEFVGFEYDQKQYDKNEFILSQAQANASLETQVTDAQLALVELYEMLA